MPHKKRPSEDRFFESFELNRETGCWEWHGGLSNGYGYFWGDDYSLMAHRYSWILFISNIPEEKELHHVCRNRKCVNPSHLELVTHHQNLRYDLVKTHCPRGHPYLPENIKTYKTKACVKTSNTCPICRAQYRRAYWEANKERLKKAHRTYHQAHREHLIAQMKLYQQRRKAAITVNSDGSSVHFVSPC